MTGDTVEGVAPVEQQTDLQEGGDQEAVCPQQEAEEGAQGASQEPDQGAAAVQGGWMLCPPEITITKVPYCSGRGRPGDCAAAGAGAGGGEPGPAQQLGVSGDPWPGV